MYSTIVHCKCWRAIQWMSHAYIALDHDIRSSFYNFIISELTSLMKDCELLVCYRLRNLLSLLDCNSNYNEIK